MDFIDFVSLLNMESRPLIFIPTLDLARRIRDRLGSQGKLVTYSHTCLILSVTRPAHSSTRSHIYINYSFHISTLQLFLILLGECGTDCRLCRLRTLVGHIFGLSFKLSAATLPGMK